MPTCRIGAPVFTGKLRNGFSIFIDTWADAANGPSAIARAKTMCSFLISVTKSHQGSEMRKKFAGELGVMALV